MSEIELAYKKNIPYFGNELTANPCNPKRAPIMRKLIRRELEKNIGFKLLEIGSWAGSSTILWATECRKCNRGKVFCIDTWAGSPNCPFYQNQTKEILRLFHHNIVTSKVEEFVVPIKGSSDEVAEILCSETFDIIYIDGDHAYSQFRRDLVNYMSKVKVGGVLCGDDYEKPLESEEDLLYALEHCEEDYVGGFHPGISLGIYVVFLNKVGSKNGFWAVRKEKGKWIPIEL